MATPKLVSILSICLGLSCSLALNAWAGAGGEGDPPCLVMKNQIDDPPGARVHGTIALDAINVAAGEADVVMRLERHGDVRFIRTHYLTSPFTAPTLQAVQNRVCEIISIPQVIGDIKTAFGLSPSITRFVFTKRGIRDAEIDVDPHTLVVPGTARAMTMADIVIFGQ
jgi:hypothetical protein